jgi:hypothetical protein
MPADILVAFNRISRSSISAAGPRYSPASDPSAPNIEIVTMSAAIEALGQSRKYKESLATLATTLEEAWKKTTKPVTKLLSNRKSRPDALVAAIRQLSRDRPGQSEGTLRDVSRLAKSINQSLNNRSEKLWRQKPEGDRSSQAVQSIDAELTYLRRFQEPVAAVLSFARSSESQLISRNRMFVRGEWGTGKTHFLCNVTKSRIERNLPTLFLLAHRLSTGMNPLDAICKSSEVCRTPRSLLRKLDRLGRRAGCRALVVVDGINEGDREVWRRGISALARETRKYDYVGLVISCRTPFDQQIMSSASRRYFTEIVHRGFQEIEFDAQREFFRFYNIPNPHVPLLAPEFSRPLFLKILCRTFAGLTTAAKSSRICAIASGQKGMTKLFEDFIDDVGRSIENDFGLPHKTCWRILKGHKITSSGPIVGLGVTMAEQLRDHVWLDECEVVVSRTTGVDASAAKKIVHRMVTDGLLVEDSIYDGEWKNVIRLSYQRFSDHLICRHLLESNLDLRSEASIRRSFYKDRPLGQIFCADKFSGTYQLPGLASAIMLEFPERVKRTLPAEERELVFYLPKKVRLMRTFVATFLEGLLWRDHSSFSKQTDRIVNMLLAQQPQSTVFSTMECLVCLASRPGHPYSSDRLMHYLLGLGLVERDLSWSEFLRATERDSAVQRSMDWIEREGRQSLTEDAARTLIRLCAIFLTTTDRRLRDRATKMLVLLGEINSRDLFEVTVECLRANDPYVPERLLAASYGVLMRCWSSPKPDLFKASGEFAKHLYDEMFAGSATHPTKHVLMRDYALNSIHLVRKIDSTCLGRRRPLKHLRPPFAGASVIPGGNTIREEACKEADSAIGMDFGNYTCGRLVRGRSNYDYKHEEYLDVMRQIKWRILDLGYRPTIFESIDREISQANFYRQQREGAGKIDRYGKKYAWISFFELYGMRDELDQLPYREPRLSDCDIDPSFPDAAKIWKPTLKPLFTTRFKSPVKWMQEGVVPSYEHLLHVETVDGIEGPWVLLNGFIEENAANDPRKTFTFLRGVLVATNEIPTLKSKSMEIEYPGNRAIPEAGSDHYTFAGEIPWSSNYAYSERKKNGSARRFVSTALESYQEVKVRKKFDNLNPMEQLRHLPDETLSAMKKALEDSESGVITAPEPRFEVPVYVDATVYRKTSGVKVEVPLHRYAWESYHSTENQVGGIDFVAPAICEALNLRNRGSSVDLYDSTGQPASLFREFGSHDAFPRSDILYVREDLVRRYLSLTNQEIVWINWGERGFKYNYFEKIRDEFSEAWQGHRHIHRMFIVGKLRSAAGLAGTLSLKASEVQESQFNKN